MYKKIKNLSSKEKEDICRSNNLCMLCSLNIKKYCIFRNSIEQISNILTGKEYQEYMDKEVQVICHF